MRRLIYVGFFTLMLSSCFMGEQEVYLIPDGFEGPVILIVGESEGQPIKYENNKRVFEVPQNGILYTQFDNQKKYVRAEYYYVDRKAKKSQVQEIQIQQLSESEKAETSDPKIYWQHVYGGGDISFIVGKPKDLDKHLETLKKIEEEIFKDGTVIMHAKQKE